MKVSYLFGGLAGLGMLLTIYGLLEYYFSLSTWPEPVRTPLKAALKARNRGDIELAERYFKKAIDAALSLPTSSLEPNPLLKITGIYVTLSSMLESDGQLVKSYIALREAFLLCGPRALEADYAMAPGQWGPVAFEEHRRAIGLAQKIGQLALHISTSRFPPPYPSYDETIATSTTSETQSTIDSPRAKTHQNPSDESTLGGIAKMEDNEKQKRKETTEKSLKGKEREKSWDEAAERYLEKALTAMLHLGLTGEEKNRVVVGRGINLPDPPLDDEDNGRVDKRGLGITMESLAEVYAKKGRYDLAMQLILQAISILLPPQKQDVEIKDQCQAALLMTTLSSHLLHPPSEQNLKHSKSWSLEALRLSERALKEKGLTMENAVCTRARSVAIYDMGVISEMQGDLTTAEKYFAQAIDYAKEVGFPEARREASEGLKRVRIQQEKKR
ncbi:hypothetical protein TREMEDRAFT_68940 [Tremella mesenterica DSM 1558]|uniref:uncharacterized protein n=1 Tax=Tremella mesenterica (strain ATCC 24925 / CBS 8224 / DSM 1558 / NBRC 9311 / NRRL Y-6157 / RJB 2259-6 / UBC 559-6) TaxID=578456 RepID=UPI0003F4A0D0|nr:uncharacterized protein TREMEDRAFT_68940 [Tremella mesenterica DSM 1558]EIW69057.1 hypothetical protein TREMEDRAFT_68940 [Tremella mesenterica DSM 1558]